MAQAYTKTVWTTGDFITADRMNNIENALENVSNEVKNASGQNAAADDTLASRINDMIMIQNTQPTSANNEIWINTSTTSPNNSIEIPTEAEFETLRNSIATQYSETATYEVGKYVLHENDLYKCTTAVNTAGTWDNNASKFTRVILGNEIEDLKSALYVQNKGRLANGTDLNTIFDNTIYLLGSQSTAQYVNAPADLDGASFLTVKQMNTIALQTIETLSGSRKTRYTDDSGATWSNWV